MNEQVYQPREIERKWQQIWEETDAHKTNEDEKNPNFIPWRCSHTLLAKDYIWVMSVFIPLVM